MTPEKLFLKDRTRDLIAAVGGVEAAAGFCRLTWRRLSECQSPTNPDVFLPIDALIDLERLSRDREGAPHVLGACCQQVDGVFTRLPKVEAKGSNLMKLLARKVQEGADVSVALCEALADGVVSPGEARKVRAVILPLMESLAAMSAELAALEGVEA